MKYIDADQLKNKVNELRQVWLGNLMGLEVAEEGAELGAAASILDSIDDIIDSLQQEQPKDVSSEIAEYFGEDIPFEDERTKAAYHFFSAGKAFELREYEEERKKHITDLLDNFQKGMNAGYEKAISELKEGKVECSPVMKELIDKLFGIGNTFNFGFGPKTLQQEHPDLPGIEEPGIPGKDYIPVDWVDACEMYGKWKIVKQEQPEVDLDADIEMEWDSFNKHLAEYGGKSEEVVWLNRYIFNEIAHYFWYKGYILRKEG